MECGRRWLGGFLDSRKWGNQNPEIPISDYAKAHKAKFHRARDVVVV